MARVIWSPHALADLRALRDLLGREAPAFARAFVTGASAAVDRLELFPRSGRMVPEIEDDALREVLHRGYRIVYLVSGPEGGEEVEVLTVFHSTRALGGGAGLEPR